MTPKKNVIFKYPISAKRRPLIVADLKQAAELLECRKSDACCHAIGSDDTQQIFEKLYREDANEYHNGVFRVFWYNDADYISGVDLSPADRILGLLFLAELIQDGAIL